jgi:hypothetical protein
LGPDEINSDSGDIENRTFFIFHLNLTFFTISENRTCKIVYGCLVTEIVYGL